LRPPPGRNRNQSRNRNPSRRLFLPTEGPVPKHRRSREARVRLRGGDRDTSRRTRPASTCWPGAVIARNCSAGLAVTRGRLRIECEAPPGGLWWPYSCTESGCMHPWPDPRALHRWRKVQTCRLACLHVCPGNWKCSGMNRARPRAMTMRMADRHVWSWLMKMIHP